MNVTLRLDNVSGTSQEPISSKHIDVPMNVRGLMKISNALFLSNDPQRVSKMTTIVSCVERIWSMGSPLSACHSERNFLGAEKRSSAYLEGGLNGEWYAPALSLNNEAPIPGVKRSCFAI
jgi:nicotinate dehydrogenase subunit B